MLSQPEKWWFIEANDVLMFRDSKPFTAGQNFTARSTFPPHPRTMQGVIRTHILDGEGADFAKFASEQEKEAIKRVVGSPSKFGELALIGPFVARRTGTDQRVVRLFRPPLDLLQKKPNPDNPSKPDNPYVVLQPKCVSRLCTNNPFKEWVPLLHNYDEVDEVEGWLEEHQLVNYLQGNSIEGVVETKNLYHTEARVGLGLDYSKRRGAESQFYHAEFIRPHSDSNATTGLLVGTDNDDGLIKDGPIAIGGEGRTGTIRAAGYQPQNLITERQGRVKVILLTPAYFTGGYKPASWERFVGKEAKLVALAIGKPQVISGWDLANKRPRPARHLVPAGSVFYFEDAALTDAAFTESPTPEAEETYGKMGFGAIATAKWDYLA